MQHELQAESRVRYPDSNPDLYSFHCDRRCRNKNCQRIALVSMSLTHKVPLQCLWVTCILSWRTRSTVTWLVRCKENGVNFGLKWDTNSSLLVGGCVHVWDPPLNPNLLLKELSCFLNYIRSARLKPKWQFYIADRLRPCASGQGLTKHPVNWS